MQVAEGIVGFALRRKGQDLPADEQLSSGDDFPRFKLIERQMTHPVRNPVAFLKSFSVKFNPAGDGRPLGHLNVAAGVVDVDGDMVTVRVEFGLRDWSGDWDDAHEATIGYVIVAE